MTSSKFSLDVSLYFLLNTRVILNKTPVSCQRYYRTTSYVDCLVTGILLALPVEDTGYGGTRGGQGEGEGNQLLGVWGGGIPWYTNFSLLSPP